ncbi:MAG: 8-amino-7-oxononanoate synthase [Bacteroidales bacterium]|nr:8-amino-7-oxononanoate synthase [Bacteroidales bacterium]
MSATINNILSGLTESGNLRQIPQQDATGNLDLSSNDYLGIASNCRLQEEFLSTLHPDEFIMSASASRLLARRQSAFSLFESCLREAYHRPALLFNSGYHANTGLISALAPTGMHIIADKLVHASIIDGIKLSGLTFDRFRHNDLAHLDRLLAKACAGGKTPLIVVESVYSMDGDRADIWGIAEIKKRYPGAMLYVDEAHAVGVCGEAGLGLAYSSGCFDDVDIVVGTLGKALASSGAYAVLSDELYSYMVNKARSLIFSTAIPPISALWSTFIFRRAMTMDSERARLVELGRLLSKELAAVGAEAAPSHIQPLIVGDPKRAVALSQALAAEGFDVLPIRTPTVPPGTDRLRFSLSAAIEPEKIQSLGAAFKKCLTNTPQPK